MKSTLIFRIVLMKYVCRLALITVFAVLFFVQPISAITTYEKDTVIATINFAQSEL